MIGRRSLLVFAVKLITAFLSFVGLSLIANLFGPGVYGAIVYAFSLVMAFSAFSDLGFNQAHIKKISEGHDINDCVSTFIAIKLGLTILLPIITFGSLFVWTQLMGVPLQAEEQTLIALFTLYYIFNNLTSIAINTYYATMEMAKAQVILLVDPIVRIPFIALIAFGGGSVIELSYAYVIAGIVTMVVALVFLFLRDQVKWTRPTLFRAYLVFTIPLALVTVVGIISGSIDKIMIGYYYSNEAVAFYSSSQFFINVIAFMGAAVATLTYPSFSKFHTEGNIAEIRKISMISERYLSMFGLPILTLLVLFPTEIAVALYGPQFAPAGQPMVWLAIGMFLTLINAVHTSQLNAVNRPDLTAKLTFLYFLIFVPLLVLLVPSSFFGVKFLGLSYDGAAIASMLTSIAIFIGTKWIVGSLTKTKLNPRLLLHLASATITGCLLLVVERYLPINGWAILLLYVAMAFGIFAVFLYALRELTKRDVLFFLDTLDLRKMWKYSVDEISGKPGN